jgi:formate dehydrogenase gamma subunit
MSEHERKYLRFPLFQRIEHLIVLLSFTILAVTGLIQKFGMVGISQWLVAVLGGLEMVRIIHRIAAVILMVETVFHIGAAGYQMYVLRKRPDILPTMADIRNGIQALRYNLRLGGKKPQQGRFTFEEKFEYWALVWGTVIMAITGFILWNPIASANVMPGEFIPAAKEVHGGEALLAVLAIIVWHMYHVHIRQFNKSMFTGYMGEEEMREEHPLELADIKAGQVPTPPDPDTIRQRQRVFFPVYGVVALVLGFFIFQFATFEKTAIETVENPRQVQVYAPLTPTPFPEAPPTPTPLPVVEAPRTWDGGIGTLFQNECAACHGETLQLANLNVRSYASLLAGGDAGPGIVPGDPQSSQVILVQEAGGHPSQFSQDEMELLIAWIEAGAPEN